MRIADQANELYRRTASLAPEASSEQKSVQPQARTTTTSFGFRLGKFGLDYREERTVVDPTLCCDDSSKKAQAQAFKAEAQVGGLRAQVGAEGADYRQTQTGNLDSGSSSALRRTAANAYARSDNESLPLPGSMLAAVV